MIEYIKNAKVYKLQFGESRSKI